MKANSSIRERTMPSLTLTTRVAPSNAAVSVVEAEGKLDMSTVEQFESQIGELFREKRYKIILDFRKLIYISSAGIGILIGVIKDVRRRGGDIKLAGLIPEVYGVFELLELPEIFQFFKTEAEAASRFAENRG